MEKRVSLTEMVTVSIAMSILAVLFTVPLNSQVVSAGDVQRKEPPPLLMGAAWYPEQWPESRWETDLELMQKAHIHMVRIGEYTWSRDEAEEGHYYLDWLERAIGMAAKHEMSGAKPIF